jgi:DnaA-homolog protein
MKQMTLDMGLAPSPCFDNFLPGPNLAAVQHLRLWAGSATRSPVPTYLWGESGSGKTHLLRAAATQMSAGGGLVGWVNAADTTTTEFDPSWTAVVLDDVHAFNSSQQHLAFKCFIEAQSLGRWVLAAGALPVADLQLRDDLRTRLGWGHVFGIQTLSEAERRSVLRQQADARGIFLKDEVMDFVLRHFSRDLGSLTQLLDHLDHYALAQQKPVTVPLVKAMLEQL